LHYLVWILLYHILNLDGLQS